MNTLALICAAIGYVGTIGSLLLLIFKKIKAFCDGQQCQLRNDITTIYYKHCEEDNPSLREYERKNLDDLYAGYKALGGNHYIDNLYDTMRKWHVTV